MKKTLSILLILAMVLSLGSAAFAEGAGTEKTVPVYRESMTGDETVTLRMVGDIPYMRIDDYSAVLRPAACLRTGPQRPVRQRFAYGL